MALLRSAPLPSLPSFPPSGLLLLLLCVSSLLPSTSALVDSGFTWSATPYQIPGAATDWGDRLAPSAGMMDYNIYVVYKAQGSSAIQYTTYNWDAQRVWTSPASVDGASSNGGASFVEYQRTAVVAWSDASSNTLTFAYQDPNSGQWGNQVTTSYSVYPSPPNLFVPLTSDMEAFYRSASATDWGGCSYDTWTAWGGADASNLQAWNHGASALTYVDSNNYFFFSGVNNGQCDGYLHFASQSQSDGSWSSDTNTGYLVDTDSTFSAVTWSNNTQNYIFVFYKYQSQLYYVAFNYNAGGYFLPQGTNGGGFPLGLSSDSGPSAVVYYDPYFDTQVVTVFFTRYTSDSNDFRVYSALGIPTSWP